MPSIETPALRCATLVAALRAEMPAGWTWNFSIFKNACGTAGCAMGLASLMWKDFPIKGQFQETGNYFVDYGLVGEFFGVTKVQATRIFSECYNSSRTTPAMVADRLEAYS